MLNYLQRRSPILTATTMKRKAAVDMHDRETVLARLESTLADGVRIIPTQPRFMKAARRRSARNFAKKPESCPKQSSKLGWQPGRPLFTKRPMLCITCWLRFSFARFPGKTSPPNWLDVKAVPVWKKNDLAVPTSEPLTNRHCRSLRKLAPAAF